jgi:putative ABC transport system ATP-binding protein
MHLMREVAVKPDRAVIIVSHDNRVFHFADRMARMDDGRIVQLREQKATEEEPPAEDFWGPNLAQSH